MDKSINRLVAACLAAVSMTTAAVSGAHAAPLRVSCYACLVVDPATDRVLFARRPDAQLPNASTTKLATALVVRSHARVDATVTVSARAAATGGGGLALEAGDRYPVGDLLAALLMTSSNDAAVALAEHIAGSEGRFVRRMNALADRLGAPDSHFLTAHGLDTAGHTASASDLAALAERVLADPVLGPIVAAPRLSIRAPQGRVLLENRNPLLESYDGAVGVKTGFTAAAGNVLVAAARQQGRLLIAVAMRARDAAADAATLLDRGFAMLARTPLLHAGAPISTLVFDPSGATLVVAGTTVRGLQHPDDVRVRFMPDPGARPPLSAGETVGRVAVIDPHGGWIASVDARAEVPVRADGSPWAIEILGSLLRLGYRIATLARGA